ncbi:hypothetical protein LTR86_007510 [Recurvomyces mirabilis]|nr:hypothetical protein LTR86_007510 [Recurvomyces mirabilis]
MGGKEIKDPSHRLFHLQVPTPHHPLPQHVKDKSSALLVLTRGILNKLAAGQFCYRTTKSLTVLVIATIIISMSTKFFDLPAEIHNEIYYESLVPTGDRPFADPSTYLPGSFPTVEGISERHSSPPGPSLLIAHPQIHREANHLFPRTNSFVFELDYGDVVAGLPAIAAWFRSLGPANVRQVMLKLMEDPRSCCSISTWTPQNRDWGETQVYDPVMREWNSVTTIPYDDRPLITSIGAALHGALDRPVNGLQIPEGYNVPGGVAQFLLNLSWSINWEVQTEWHSALHSVNGEAYVKTDKKWNYGQHVPHLHNPRGGISW